jgi:hypothetical protein
MHTVTLKPAGHTETAFAGVPWSSSQYCHHNDLVSKPPAGAVVLASSERCPLQAFRAGMRTYGFQFHFEADRAMIEDFVRECPEEVEASGGTVESVLAEVGRRYDSFARVGARLSLNIASYMLSAPGLREVVDVARAHS